MNKTVKIKLTRQVNLDHYGVSSGTVVNLDLETEYLPICISSEIYESNSRTPMEAKKAQAIAARNYVLAHTANNTIIDDTATYQAFKWKDPATIPNSVQACLETSGQALFCGEQLITAWYSNSNGGRTKRSDEAWSAYKPWTVAQDDPWDVGGRKKWGECAASHSVGMSQIGAAYAAYIGRNCKEILAFYYPSTIVQGNYGEAEDSGGVVMVEKPSMGMQILTANDCYSKGRSFAPRGIVVHSTGANNPYLKRYVGPDDGVLGQNTNGNHWNTPGFDKCANAFIGRTDNGEVMIYQTLPWTWRPWLCGKGAKGTYNDTHIQFEMCEDGLTNESYWKEVRAKAVHLCAWLCQEYRIEVRSVIGHYEAAAAGYANNHADPQNWMKKFGDSMAAFRVDVDALLGNTGGGVSDMEYPYKATVKTKYGMGIGLWNDSNKTRTVATVPEGAVVDVIGKPDDRGFALAAYGGDTGVIDTQYLVPVREGGGEPEAPALDIDKVRRAYALLGEALEEV